MRWFRSWVCWKDESLLLSYPQSNFLNGAHFPLTETTPLTLWLGLCGLAALVSRFLSLIFQIWGCAVLVGLLIILANWGFDTLSGHLGQTYPVEWEHPKNNAMSCILVAKLAFLEDLVSLVLNHFKIRGTLIFQDTHNILSRLTVTRLAETSMDRQELHILIPLLKSLTFVLHFLF